MSAGESLEKTMSRALELEKNYDWMSSVELYRAALGMVPDQDVLKTADIHERIGYSLFRAAMQADSVEDFKKRMRMSVEAYEKAAELFDKAEPARGLCCRGMARYSESWFVEKPSEKKMLLDDCLKTTEEGLESLDVFRHHLTYWRCFNNLLFSLLDKSFLAEDRHENKRIAEEVINYGQNAVAKLSQVGDANELTCVYALTSLLIIFFLDSLEERKEELVSLSSNYLKKALGLSEGIEDALTLYWLNSAQATTNFLVKGDLQAASKFLQEDLRQSERLNDHFLLGITYLRLNNVSHYEGFAEEDPDKSKEIHKRAIRFAEESIRQCLQVHRYDWVSRTHSMYLVESLFRLAESETNLEEKRALLKRAVEVGRKGHEYAQLSGSLESMGLISHSLSKAAIFLSEIETNVSERRKLLEEALELREKSIEIGDKIYPPYEWNLGVFQNWLALIKADLAKIEESEEKKRHLLAEAVSSMEKCLEICTYYLQKIALVPLPRNIAVLGGYHDWFGDILTQQYSLTKDENIIDRTIGTYRDAAQAYEKAGMPSRVAEAHWKVARLYSRLGDYAKAAENFEQASKNYQLVAEKIPQFKCFYQDHTSYMQAWSEFEKAKLAHQREQYEQARTRYENAASLLKSTKRWSYLAANFTAWATLELAEDLSKKEKSDESKQAFQLAAQQFSEAKASLEEEAKKIESQEEKANALELSQASDYRREYCLARAELEEATIHDKKGEHSVSAEKYGSVAERFEKIADKLGDESDRNELLFQANLCRALERMELAEEKAEPDLYAEASELFTKTQKITTKKRNALLALGNACFCKALEAGTKFKLTPNAELYATAKQYMERAAHHYTEAGFETASKWTKATQRLFDAYFYMCNAEAEVDPEKKAKHYQLAERHLDLAARLYETAGYLTKRDEILRHLVRVREEKELLITPIEILKAPTIVSAAPTISTPTPTNEEAVGLEGFEHANIQANLIIRLKEFKVGEDVSLELELVNAGKRPALLIKTEHIIPEGFEIRQKPEIYRVEDSYLNMKGKRLDPLKTEEVKLVLKALSKGTFTLKPKILYLDETGKYRSHEPEPTTIKVKELGISGWLKGP